MIKLINAAIISLGLMLSAAISAADLEPRSYVNLPTGLNFLAYSYAHSKGDVNPAPSVPIHDAEIKFDANLIAYSRSFAINEKSAKFDVVTSHVCTSGKATLNDQVHHRDVCGISDTRVRLLYNFYGAPAYNMQEFRKQSKELVIGASLQLSIPTGQYDETKLLNIGANRWYIRPEIGMSFPWKGLDFELALDAKIFTDNDEFFGDVALEQDPLFNLQSHVVYDISPRQWLSFDINYFFGGQTYKDGNEVHDEQKNSRFGATYSFAITRQYIAKLYFSQGLITRIGNDSTLMGVAIIYSF